MDKLITSEHLSDIKFAADCAIKEPDSIYSQEFFMLLDETFGSKGDYESPTQAVAVAWLINRVNELERRAEAAEALAAEVAIKCAAYAVANVKNLDRAEAAEAEVEDTDKTMRAYSDQLVKVTAELVAAQAQLAERDKQKAIFQVEVSGNHWLNAGPVDESDFTVLPDGVNLLYTHPAPAAVPVDLLPDESGLADRHIAWLNTLQRPMFSDEDWEELSLYTWLAFRHSFRVYHAEMLRRIEGLKK